MNKFKIVISSLALSTALISSIKAEQATVENEEPSADFLDFLAEVEDATGDGFEVWLETKTDADK